MFARDLLLKLLRHVVLVAGMRMTGWHQLCAGVLLLSAFEHLQLPQTAAH